MALTASRWRDYLTGFCQAFDWLSVPDIQGYPHRNEEEAIREDWQKVGDAMLKVVGELEKTIAEETPRGMAGQTEQASMDRDADAREKQRDQAD